MSEDRISRNAGYALVTQLVGAVFTAALMVFLGRELSPQAYGFFAFAVSVVTLATLFADLGISASAGRFMAERVHDREGAAEVFRTALRLKLVLAAAVAVVLFTLAEPISAAFGSAAATWALRGVAVALVGQSMFILLLGSFTALRRQRFSAMMAAAESVVEVAASVALVLMGAGAAGAAFGRAIGYAVGLVVGLAIATRVIGRPRRRGRRGASSTGALARRIVRYAGPLLLVDAAFRVFSSIDVLLVSAILGGGAAVAAFELPMRLITFVDYPAAAAASAVAPRLARHADRRPDVAMFATVLRCLILLQVVFVPPLLIWPEAIIHLLFGNRYADAPAVLRALAPYVFLSGIAQPVTLAVNYLGEARRRVPIAVAMLTVNVVVDVTLLKHIGVVAAGLGTSAAYLVWVPAHFRILHRRAGVPIGPFLGIAGRATLAGAAMTGALALLGTGDVAIWRMAVGAFVGPAVYVLALVALRELRHGDLAALRGMARRAM